VFGVRGAFVECFAMNNLLSCCVVPFPAFHVSLHTGVLCIYPATHPPADARAGVRQTRVVFSLLLALA